MPARLSAQRTRPSILLQADHAVHVRVTVPESVVRAHVSSLRWRTHHRRAARPRVHLDGRPDRHIRTCHVRIRRAVHRRGSRASGTWWRACVVWVVCVARRWWSWRSAHGHTPGWWPIAPSASAVPPWRRWPSSKSSSRPITASRRTIPASRAGLTSWWRSIASPPSPSRSVRALRSERTLRALMSESWRR